MEGLLIEIYQDFINCLTEDSKIDRYRGFNHEIQNFFKYIDLNTVLLNNGGRILELGCGRN